MRHTQIGHTLIWALLGAAAIPVAVGAPLLISIVSLLLAACFYKLTIKIDNETLRASFGTA